RFVDAAPRGHLSQPEDQMRTRLDLRQVAIELQENVLRDLLAAMAVAEEVPRDAEDHRLVVGDQGGERVAVAALRAAQDFFRLADLGEQSAHGLYIRRIWRNDCATTVAAASPMPAAAARSAPDGTSSTSLPADADSPSTDSRR